MNALELALKCKNSDCNLCTQYDTMCKEFMQRFELTPQNIISILTWNSGVSKTMLDVAVQCYTTSKCSKCEYKEPKHCPMTEKTFYAPEDLLEELFKEVKNDNS